MAHFEQRAFVVDLKSKYQNYFIGKKVLDIGSLNINGTMRDFFEDCDYTGLDIDEGPGVDVVCQGQEYDAPDNYFDVACSAECFEHNPYWLETFQNMIRMCRKGGLVFFTCATEGRAEHGTERSSPDSSPFTVNLGWSYYRNLTEKDFTDAMNFDDYFSSYGFKVNPQSFDLYFWGVKKGSIPVLGTAIVNGTNWLYRLIDSVDYPVDEFVIINNNGRDEITTELDLLKSYKHKYINKIKVAHMPQNIGCSGAWNLIIKSYMLSPFWVIVNHDIKFSPGILEQLYASSYDNNYGVIHAEEDKFGIGKWDLFLIKDWTIKQCGLFDENLYPAYDEDLDYVMRMINTNIKPKFLGIPYLHGDVDYATTGSQTWRTDLSLKDKLYHSMRINENEYMDKKWGEGWRMCSPFKTPFNSDEFDNKYTTYDLDFVRGKHLGF